MSLFRRIRPMAVVAVGLVVAGPVVQGYAARRGDDLTCRVANQITERADGWVQIRTPDYAENEGPDAIAAFAAPEIERARIYVTNGKTVMVSLDHGCTFARIAGGANDFDDSPVPIDYGQQYQPDNYTHLYAPTTKGLWIVSFDESNGVRRPHTYFSKDASPAAGNEPKSPFARIDVGLPNVGTPVAFAASSRDPQNAFLILDELPDVTSGEAQKPARRFYTTRLDQDMRDVSIEVALRWEPVVLPDGFGDVRGVKVFGAGTRTIWAWSDTKFAFSLNGGTSWSTPQKAAGEIAALDVAANGVAAIFSRTGQGPMVEFSAEGRSPYGQSSLPGDPSFVAHGSRSGVYSLTGKDGTFGFDVRLQKWINITPAGNLQLLDLQMPNGGRGKIMLARTDKALFRFDLYSQELFVPPAKDGYVAGYDPNVILELPKSDLPAPRLAKRRFEVTVEPGKVKEVKPELLVPPGPSPLDVFFLMDTTSSMNQSIVGLRTGIKNIARTLRKAGVNVQFGVGDFKDVTAVSPNVTQRPEAHRVYQLRQAITANDALVEAAIDKLVAGGGGEEPEAQTMALISGVTGKAFPPYIDADQHARFRPEAFKLILLISDAAMNEGMQFNYPTIAETIDTLNAYDVKVAGVLALGRNDAAAAGEDMRAVVAGTETFAPRAGVDCDRDGSLDLAEGDPLVCETANQAPNITPAIVSLLLGVADPGMIGIDLAGDTSVVRKVTGDTAKVVNLKLENRMKYTVAVTCTPLQDGKDIVVNMLGHVRAKVVDKGDIVVKCRSIPVPPVIEEPPPPVKKFIQPVIPPPMIPPPPLVFNGQPPQNPLPNSNPNTGFAQEEEKQFQLATVSQTGSEQQQEEESTDLAMSALSRDDPAAAPLMMGAMAMTAIAACAAVQNRRRTQHRVRPALARARIVRR